MTLAKVKEQDGMMLAKVKEQDGIMLANVKVPSIPTSAACCDDVQLTKLMRNPFPIYTPFTTVNYFIGLRPPNTATCSLFTTVNYFIGLRPPNTDTSSYLQLSTTSSDCVLLKQIPLYLFTTVNYFIGLRPPSSR